MKQAFEILKGNMQIEGDFIQHLVLRTTKADCPLVEGGDDITSHKMGISTPNLILCINIRHFVKRVGSYFFFKCPVRTIILFELNSPF